MKRLTRFAPVVAAVGLMALANLAHATLITGTNSDFTVNWFLASGAADNDGNVNSNPFNLSANADFDVTTYSYNFWTNQTDVVFNIKFTNTTVVPAGQNAGVTSFGLGVSPNLYDVDFSDSSDGGFINAIQQTGNQNFPGGFKNIDVCIFTQGCSGGSQGSAIAANGDSDTFWLILTFGGDVSSIVLDPFPIKIQTSSGSYEFAGCTQNCTTTKVPEPGTLSLLGAGMVGLGLLRRRRRADV
jgi:hypothetical protein